MKNFFRHWHYGVKAKVVDKALVADIDTAIEPLLVRLDLSRLLAVGFEVQLKNNVYELMLTGVGAPAATTALAKFEVREAADEACACLKRALLCGEHKSRFRAAFKSTLGVLAALAVGMLLFVLTSGRSASDTGSSLMNGVSGLSIPTAAAPAAHESGVPQTADQFLNGQ